MTGFGNQREEEMLRSAPLMGGDDVLEVHQILHGRFEPVEARRAGIALIAGHHRAPLRRAHGRRATIGQQIDQHVIRMQLEQIVARIFQQSFALVSRGHADRLDRFDAEGFDNGLHLSALLALNVLGGADNGAHTGLILRRGCLVFVTRPRSAPVVRWVEYHGASPPCKMPRRALVSRQTRPTGPCPLPAGRRRRTAC